MSFSLIPFIGQLVFILTLPITLTIVVFFYAYKQAVILCSKILDKQFIKPVSGSSILFLCDDLTTNPWSIIATAFTLNEVPSKEKIYNDLEQILELRRASQEKGLIYWKLKSYVVKWRGYFWWKRDKHFSVKNHVSFIQREIESPDDICKIVEKLMRKPFKVNRSYWDITVVTNSASQEKINDKCVLLFRFSHGLMDGLTFLKLWFRLGGYTTLPEGFPRMQVKFNPLIQKLSMTVLGISLGIYEYLSFVCSNGDFNPIRSFSKETPPSGDWLCSSVRPINLHRFKKAKKTLKCSFLDLTLTGISGGMEKFMESKGNVPKHMKFLAPIPKFDHPDDRVDNHFYFTAMKFPLKIPNLRDRLKAIQENSKSGAPTPFSGVMDFLTAPLNILPVASFVKEITNLQGFTGLGSFMTVGHTIPRIFGQEPTVIQYWLPIGRFDSAGMTFSVASSTEDIRINFVVDRSTMSTSDIENLAKYILNEFESIIQLAH